MNLHFLLIFIIARYLRKNLKTAEFFPEWDVRLLWTSYAALFLMAVSLFIEPMRALIAWIGEAALVALLWAMMKEPVFQTVRFLLVALAPYIVASFLQNVFTLIAPAFYDEWNSYFENATAFAIIWIVGVWLVVRNQQKELLKEQQRTLEQEQNNKFISAMKDRLEVQVAERTAELTKQKEELELTLQELKATQAQLIHSEKMASLGELTAGIAHEIQNPLNFVNNFSEVSTELIAEMKQEMQAGNSEEVLAIAGDLEQNLTKITFHGKRADSIVKGMLQHSRKNTGQPEPTNINALADEYLRLSYHGLRAKDKLFNAALKTEFDDSIGTITIVPQDVGRVLLNLFNNAFYAVNEKKKAGNSDYHPEVCVKTQKLQDKVIIKVEDNGNGIPSAVLQKIFQPFFSTKPAGEGTGLGLSLSYDIITKQHGGSIQANSTEGAGTTITIALPCK